MRAHRTTSPGPSVGDTAPVDVRALQSRLRAMTKRDAVAYLRTHAEVTRSWAERHVPRLESMTPAEFGTALSQAASPAFIRHLRTLDPTGDTAARNVDRARREAVSAA